MKHLLLLLLCSPVVLFSQNKQLTLEKITGDNKLHPQKITQLQWKDNRHLTWVDTNQVYLRQMDARTGDTRILMQLQQIKEMLADSLPELEKFPSIKWVSNNSFRFKHGPFVFIHHLNEDSLRWVARLPEATQAIEMDEHSNVAYVHDHNLYVVPNNTQAATQVTNDGHRKLTYGLAASRYEFGIRKGIFWSPEGKRVAFYKVDHSAVSDYPLVDYSTTPAKHQPINYPMNGDSSQHVKLGVYNIADGTTTYLETKGPYDQYLTNITWSPGGHYIYIAVVNRDQNEMQLKQYDANSGIFIRTLFTETDDKYVEPEHGPIFFPKSNDEFLWMSKRDGYNHLYWYKTTGNLVKQITSGDFEVTKFLGIDKREKHLYYESTEPSPLSRHIHRYNLKNDESERITSLIGFHHGTLSEEGNNLIIETSSYQLPYRATCMHDGTFKDSEHTIYEAPAPLDDYQLGEMEVVELEAEDDTKLYGRLIKPADFNENDQYPVLVYVYGGPHVQMVNNDWLHGARLFLQYMAQQGFVIFTVDNRGSAYRGLDFEQQVFGELGTKEMEDQETGVEYLRTLPYVDTSKLAVFGWSYGGYMSTSLMLRKPGLFHVGVAGGPVTDWRLYEVMYSERYMDRHQDNEEGFENTDLRTYAENLKGRLMIIHGMQDNVVVPQHSMQLMREFVKKGKVVDYFPYPSYPHNVRGPERSHLYRIIEDYIKTHLNIH